MNSNLPRPRSLIVYGLDQSHQRLPPVIPVPFIF
jgi:hypothetical protein